MRLTPDQIRDLPPAMRAQVEAELARPRGGAAKEASGLLFPGPQKPASQATHTETTPGKQNGATALAGGKARLRQDRKGPNKTEAEFLAYLDAQPEYRLQQREGVTLKLGNGVRYTPDFTAVWAGQAFHCFETKGFLRDDAAVKIKVAASLFPVFVFYLVTKRTKKQGGGWSIERVLP